MNFIITTISVLNLLLCLEFDLPLVVVLASQVKSALLFVEQESAVVGSNALLNSFINLVAVVAETVLLQLVIKQMAAFASDLGITTAMMLL